MSDRNLQAGDRDSIIRNVPKSQRREDRTKTGAGLLMHLLLSGIPVFLVYALFERRPVEMEKKEVKKWQDEEALKRYRMIAVLRQQMRLNL